MREHSKADPDRQCHVFRTFMGIVPDTDDPPVCGAVLTSAYNGKGAPRCPACEVIIADHRARILAGAQARRDAEARR